MARGHERIRIPRLRAFVVALTTLVVVGLLVFLQRYRGADRTAMVLSMLGGGGLCLVVALIWFQRRWSDQEMARRKLWGIGLCSGAVAGLCTSGVGVGLLALRWALDQHAAPGGDLFLPAFFHALAALGMEMAQALPAYGAAGAVLGALVGLAVAEAIGISADRVTQDVPASDTEEEALPSSHLKT